MRIIGLCGGSGAGKGQVCRAFEQLGIPSVDTDAVSRTVMKKGNECYREVVEAFGKSILDENGEIIRKKLASVIFNDAQKKRILEEITHKHIINFTLERIAEFENKGIEYAIVDAPLLFESGLDRICYKTIAVVADEEIRIRRIMERDNITREFAVSRIMNQISSDELVNKCDYVIYNNSDLDALGEAVRRIAHEIKI